MFTGARRGAGERALLDRCSPPPRWSAPSGGTSLHRQVADVLRDAVAKHMRADVTVGAFPVRRGIDSTAIAAMGQGAQPET